MKHRAFIPSEAPGTWLDAATNAVVAVMLLGALAAVAWAIWGTG